ncbi:hypothetical protein F5148DRAFT_1231887 [Russula earlei]|uniref:Uncharacterized protein n=1 Tax=Russula earlei TaxID=71964 RepID=A0ACC0U0D0_9AGAM|nr:hypothetical protein F5148DRAFT_1231887 [Russula earlei]
MPLTRATTRAATATLLITIAITTCHLPLSLPPLHLPSPLPQNVCIKMLDQGWSKFQPPGRCKVNHGWSLNHGTHLTPLWYWLST